MGAVRDEIIAQFPVDQGMRLSVDDDLIKAPRGDQFVNSVDLDPMLFQVRQSRQQTTRIADVKVGVATAVACELGLASLIAPQPPVLEEIK